jgi:hypothetical protein
MPRADHVAGWLLPLLLVTLVAAPGPSNQHAAALFNTP